MEPAEPLNGGSLGIRATLLCLITVCFQGVSSKVEEDTVGVEVQRMVVVLGTAREIFSWLSVWM